MSTYRVTIETTDNNANETEKEILAKEPCRALVE